MKLRIFSMLVLVLVFSLLAVSARADSIDLGTAISFGLIGGTISNTGTSVVTGNVGVKDAAGTITGFNPTGTTVGGSVIAPGSTASNNAYIDFVNAFNAANILASTQSYADLTVNRTFLGNNVYTFGGADISTTTGINLTFDAQNNPNEVFVIRTDGAFTANGALTFTLQNQAQADNIFWIIGTIATISVGSSGPITFDGNILAGESFTMSAASGGSGVLAGTINGCVFAETANTLAGTTDVKGCSGTTSGGTTGTPPAVPEPGSIALLGSGLFVLAGVVRRKLCK
jgi:type VI secretion system secreted protein VgrG